MIYYQADGIISDHHSWTLIVKVLNCDIVHALICNINRHLLVGHSRGSSLSSYLGSLSFDTEYRSTTSAALSEFIIVSSLFHSRLPAATLKASPFSLCASRLFRRWNNPLPSSIYLQSVTFLQLFIMTMNRFIVHIGSTLHVLEESMYKQ